MRTIHILSLGAGVQSTALYLKFLRGDIGTTLDYAIFADTQEEPREVYAHLDWLRSLNGPPILVGTVGKLGDNLAEGVNSSGGRFVSIPAFTSDGVTDGHGIMRRQCSREYKTDVVGKVLRREILGLAPGRSPTGVAVVMHIGISLDEAGRAARVERNNPPPKYLTRRFDLIERNETRTDCVNYLADKVPHRTPRSACVFCPYHTDYEWHLQKTADPVGFARSVEIDHALRATKVTRGDTGHQIYLHRSCKPLELVEFDTSPPTTRATQLRLNFSGECEGMCGV